MQSFDGIRNELILPAYKFKSAYLKSEGNFLCLKNKLLNLIFVLKGLGYQVISLNILCLITEEKKPFYFIEVRISKINFTHTLVAIVKN